MPLTNFTQTQENAIYDGERGDVAGETNVEATHDESDDGLREEAQDL